jgi:hypothetical protein
MLKLHRFHDLGALGTANREIGLALAIALSVFRDTRRQAALSNRPDAACFMLLVPPI